MVQKLEMLKEKITRGTTEAKDVDIINEAIAYMQRLEENAMNLPEPAFLETKEELFPSNVIIENATIYIGQSKEEYFK